MKPSNDTFGFCNGLVVVSAVVLVCAACGGKNPSSTESSSTGAGGSSGRDAAVSVGAVSAGGDTGVVASSGGAGTSAIAQAGSASVAPADGGATVTTPDGGDAPCTVTDAAAICISRAVVSLTHGADTRRIYWATPTTPPPANGFPAVVLYQGSFFGPSHTWGVSIPRSTGFGGYYQVALVAKLLDAGFVVVQPEAQGGLFWDTNNGTDYDTSTDAVFIPDLLSRIGSGEFGPVDTSRLYATGISSGGYMTSRMAVSYAGKFRALAIESGSYATCLGPICTIPPTLPADHPPTLFLHGDQDTIVPIATAKPYYQALQSAGIETKFDEDPTATHQWLSVAPEDVTGWFLAH